MKRTKKILNLFACSFLLLFVFILTSCGEKDNNKSNFTLDTPTEVRITEGEDGNYLFYKEVKNATGYYAYVYDFESNTLKTRYVLTGQDGFIGYSLELQNGTYLIKVSAYNKTESSDQSEGIKLVVDIKGNKPNPTPDPNAETYTITYNLFGGALSSNAPTTYKEGTTVTLPTATKSGFKFVGWYLNNGYTGNKVTTISSSDKGNKEFFAKWVEKTQTDVNLTGYYASADGKDGADLKAALRSIINNTKKNTSYDDLKVKLPYTDADPKNSSNLILLYSQMSFKGRWNGGGTGEWNREHVWPQSKGWFKTSGAGSDIHHIRPEDNQINSKRGNLPYGYANGGTPVMYKGVQCGTIGSGRFEPTDQVKGDVARIVMYLLVRYSASDSYKISAILPSFEVMLEWNELDPVNDFEKVRNERCYEIQGNRNPFIDHPELAEQIWG